MIDGLVVVDKPAAWTSHDVVARCRRIFGQKRVGHSGTLDPDATGVLLVGLGRATRLLRWLTELPKTYVGEVVLGTATSTLDASGEVVASFDMAGVGVGDVRRVVASSFVGEIEQVPPMVSAVHVGGKRLHELARAGIEVERAPRVVMIERFEVLREVEPGVFEVEVTCSSGTYVRTLAADVGAALGGGAHLRNLRRTAIGSFTVDRDATALDALGEAHVLSPFDALRDYPATTIGPDAARDVSHGNALTGLPDGVVRVADEAGALLAVYEDGKPAVVIAAA